MEKITYANACYSGGGIYLFYAELENGNYIFTSTEAGDSEAHIEIFDSNDNGEPFDNDVIWDCDWMDAHRVESFESYEMWNSMLNWIINNNPIGNYSVHELEKWLIKFDKFASDEDVITYKNEIETMVMNALDNNDEKWDELCKTGIQISIGGKTLKLYLGAENFNALDSFLEDVIENCEQ